MIVIMKGTDICASGLPIHGGYVELHAHLDGSVTPDIGQELARLQGIELPEDKSALKRMFSVSKNCRDLNSFLECFSAPLSLLQTAEALKVCTELVLENMRSAGVIYAELRFAPQYHTTRGLSQKEAVAAVLQGIDNSPIPANLILCCMRSNNNERENRITLELAKRLCTKRGYDGGVSALDLAGAEGLYPTEAFVPLLREAAESGVPLTVHAGEAGGDGDIRSALCAGAVRIGHGVRLVPGGKTERAVLERGVFLELCPTSNRITGAVEDMNGYPLKHFLESGIRATVNTDDPAIVKTTLAGEFDYIRQKFGISDGQLRQLQENAVDAAFASDGTKRDLRRRLGL